MAMPSTPDPLNLAVRIEDLRYFYSSRHVSDIQPLAGMEIDEQIMRNVAYRAWTRGDSRLFGSFGLRCDTKTIQKVAFLHLVCRTSHMLVIHVTLSYL